MHIKNHVPLELVRQAENERKILHCCPGWEPATDQRRWSFSLLPPCPGSAPALCSPYSKAAQGLGVLPVRCTATTSLRQVIEKQQWQPCRSGLPGGRLQPLCHRGESPSALAGCPGDPAKSGPDLLALCSFS